MRMWNLKWSILVPQLGNALIVTIQVSGEMSRSILRVDMSLLKTISSAHFV